MPGVAVVFVLPTSTAGSFGPVAAYLSTAGWAAAGARELGASWIVCPSGVIDPAEARRRATTPAPPVATAATAPAPRPSALQRIPRSWRRRVPAVVKTLLKDVRQRWHADRFTVAVDGPWAHEPIDFVWQRHELFHSAGLDLADELGCPSVLFVPSTAVWEAERWGTRRPGWGELAERFGERPALRRADLVACGSPEVAEQAIRLGAAPDRVIVTPTGVDLDLFDPAGPDRDLERKRLRLTDRFVVGWVGSFRPFHSIGRLLDAVEHLPGVTLLLVGDGPERSAMQEQAAARGVDAVFTGTVGHTDLGRYLAAMDVGLVMSPSDAAFHYSPLKLAEYLASGLPVVAPAVGSLTARLTSGEDSLLVDPADDGALRDAITRLHDDPDLRRRLGQAGLAQARAHWSWDEQVRAVQAALVRTGRIAPPPRPSTPRV